MTEKRFRPVSCVTDWYIEDKKTSSFAVLTPHQASDLLNELHEENMMLKEYNIKLMKQALLFDVQTIPNTMEIMEANTQLEEENEKLKAQLYCDDEEGVCNICKYHYLVKDDETELGYYNSRCQKGHYECARVSLKYCEDFEKELKMDD